MGDQGALRVWKAARLSLVALLLVILALSSTLPSTHSSTRPQDQLVTAIDNVGPSTSSSQAIIAFSPSNVTSLSITSGLLSFNVTVTNSTAINGFSVVLSYNPAVLNFNTIDYANNVLGSKADVINYCVGGVLFVGSACPNYNSNSISFALSLLGNVTSPPITTGVLFKLNFNVIARGFSALHIIQTELSNGGVSVPFTSVDAYFTNTDCPHNSGILCKPPIAKFTVTPARPLVFRTITFNASASTITNLGPPSATIKTLYWDFGDLTSDKAPTLPNGQPNSTIQHQYHNTCNCSVTLGVTDTYNATAYSTLVIGVIAVFINVYPIINRVIPQFRVSPGTTVQIIIYVVNNSTFPEDGSVSVKLDDGRIVSQPQSFHLGAFRQQTTVTEQWITNASYATRVYRIDAVVPPIPGANKTSNNIASTFVELISSPPTGLASLNLLQSSGLAILVLAGVVFGASRFLRRKPVEEAL
jgi:hypothetical protein